MAEIDAETRDTGREQDDSMKQSGQVTEHGPAEVGIRLNRNNSADGDDTRGRCCSCCEFCRVCCRPCMTEHNPLPASPTRLVIDLCLWLHF